MIAAFVGEDRLAREEALKGAVETYLAELAGDPQSKENLYADETYEEGLAARVEELCESQSLFSPKRAVIIRNLEKIKKAESDLLAAYIPKANPECGLFLVGGKIDGRSALSKAIPKKNLKKFETIPEYKIPQWIQSFVHEKWQRRISPNAAEYLRDLVGSDCAQLSMEIEKMVSSGEVEQEIKLEQIQKMVAAQRPLIPWMLNTPFGLRNGKEFFHLLPLILSQDVQPFMVVQSLYRHISKLTQIQELQQKRTPVDEILKALGIRSEYVYNKVQQLPAQAGRRTPKLYRRLLVRLAEMEYECKSGFYTHRADFERAMFPLI